MNENEAERLRQELQTIKERQLDEWRADTKRQLNDHEARLREVEGSVHSSSDHEVRIRALENTSARSAGIGLVGKVLIPILLTIGANLVFKVSGCEQHRVEITAPK
jgi:hypothetical protein